VRAELVRVCPGRHMPLLVKIAPDLADADIDAVADLALELKLDGLIATNTTISRAGLQTAANQVAALGAGGLSGAPLKARSLEVLQRLRARVGTEVTLISVGGIETVADVCARLDAGATLVQVYSALIYGGPALVGELTRGLERRIAGKSSVC
jgi:dihydroorotate dehydrogenase